MRQVAGQQVPRVGVDHRRCVPPAINSDVDGGHVHLPEIVAPLSQRLKHLGQLLALGIKSEAELNCNDSVACFPSPPDSLSDSIFAAV